MIYAVGYNGIHRFYTDCEQEALDWLTKARKMEVPGLVITELERIEKNEKEKDKMTDFYMVYVEGKRGSKIKYDNWEAAKTEAKRLSDLEGKDAYVLRAVEVIEAVKIAKTLEEALKAERLRIEWPKYVGQDIMTYIKGGSWALITIVHIHAALSLPGATVYIEEE